MTINTRVPLSNEARTELKKAISAHPDVATALKDHGLNSTANALVGQIWSMADSLDIDAAPIIAGADLAASIPGPVPAPAPVANVTATATASAKASDLDGIMGELELFIRPDMATRLRAGILALAATADSAKRNAEAANAARVAAEELAANAPAAPAVIHTAPAASRGPVSTLGAVFGIRGNWAKVPCQTWTPCKDTPPIDPGYVFDPEVLGLVVSALDRGTNAWVHGPKGSGKTELATQIAARTGRPLTRIGLAADMDKYAMLGLRAPDETGKFVWSDGILAQAYRTPGCLILLDEPTFAAPGLLAVIQTSVDVRKITLEDTGEKVTFADGVCVMAADNTDGHGGAEEYAGTQPMNTAFLDRFSRKVRMDTPDKAMLTRILTARTGLAAPVTSMLAQLMKDSERLAANQGLSSHLSIRPVLTFCHDLAAGLPAAPCFEATILASLPAGESETLRQHCRAHFKVEDLEALLNPAPAGVTPAGRAAQADFSAT